MNIPHPVYTNQPVKTIEQQDSPPTSPTFSAVTEIVANEQNVLQKEFVVNKKLFATDFYSKENEQKGCGFSKIFYKEDMISKNNFMNLLKLIKFIFYSLIGWKYMLLQTIFHTPFQNLKPCHN